MQEINNQQYDKNELTSANSVTATRILYKAGVKGYKLLTKYFGIYADIYKPVKPNNPKENLHGFYDDKIQYDEVPYLQIKVLIPSLFRRRNSTNLSMLDPFIDSETYMYLPENVEIEKHSMIVCRLSNKKIYNWRVNGMDVVENDSGIIIKRYPLVPIMSIDVRKNITEIQENLEKELERFKKEKEYSSSMTTYNNAAKNEFTHKPLDL